LEWTQSKSKIKNNNNFVEILFEISPYLYCYHNKNHFFLLKYKSSNELALRKWISTNKSNRFYKIFRPLKNIKYIFKLQYNYPIKNE
jgi:hypothetical protein